VLEQVEIVSHGDANKERLGQDQVEALIDQVSQIKVAKGKKILLFNPLKDDRSQIMKAILGRSGTLRSPTLRIGNGLIVGYSQEVYQQVQQELT